MEFLQKIFPEALEQKFSEKFCLSLFSGMQTEVLLRFFI